MLLKVCDKESDVACSAKTGKFCVCCNNGQTGFKGCLLNQLQELHKSFCSANPSTSGNNILNPSLGVQLRVPQNKTIYRQNRSTKFLCRTSNSSWNILLDAVLSYQVLTILTIFTSTGIEKCFIGICIQFYMQISIYIFFFILCNLILCVHLHHIMFAISNLQKLHYIPKSIIPFSLNLVHIFTTSLNISALMWYCIIVVPFHVM